MGASLSLRFLLLGLLPAIALLLYVEGQQYDPALIRFQSSPASAEGINDFFPDEIAEFKRSGRIRSFTKDNLYEYVNGHAEYFISSGFTSLSVGEYSLQHSTNGEPDVVIDIYDMGTSIQAFGILSDESGGQLSEISNGLSGFKTPLGLSFTKGQYFIKVSAYNENVSLDKITGSIERRIVAGSDPFPEFSHLPDIGEVVTTRFIKEDYRGLDFVKNVIEREYRVDGENIQIFVVTVEKREIYGLVTSFINYFRDSEIEFRELEMKGTKIYRIEDPYEGKWVLVPLKDKLFGIFGSFNDAMIDSIITGTG
jgi:hypothetical protein